MKFLAKLQVFFSEEIKGKTIKFKGELRETTSRSHYAGVKEKIELKLDEFGGPPTKTVTIGQLLDLNEIDCVFVFTFRVVFKSFFKRKTDKFCGLVNSGNTCYMNSFLQMLFHLKAFVKSIFLIDLRSEITQNHLENCHSSGKDSIILAFQELFFDMEERQKSSIKTETLQQSFGWNKSNAWYQQDTHEFYCLLMEAIEKKARQYGSPNIVSGLFQGELLQYIQCKHIQFKSERKELFKDIQVRVQECSSLQESLKILTEPVELTGDNQYMTDDRFGKQDALKGITFISLPDVLIIHLERYAYDPESNRNFKIMSKYEFPVDLDMGPYSTLKDNTEFSLFSILVHAGESINSGHYYGFTRTEEGQWIMLNDQSVHEVDLDYVLRVSYGGKTSKSRLDLEAGMVLRDEENLESSAYMLVYVRRSKVKEILGRVEERPLAVLEERERSQSEKERNSFRNMNVKFLLTSPEKMRENFRHKGLGALGIKNALRDETSFKEFKKDKGARMKLWFHKEKKVEELAKMASSLFFGSSKTTEVHLWKYNQSKDDFELIPPVTSYEKTISSYFRRLDSKSAHVLLATQLKKSEPVEQMGLMISLSASPKLVIIKVFEEEKGLSILGTIFAEINETVSVIVQRASREMLQRTQAAPSTEPEWFIETSEKTQGQVQIEKAEFFSEKPFGELTKQNSIVLVAQISQKHKRTPTRPSNKASPSKIHDSGSLVVLHYAQIQQKTDVLIIYGKKSEEFVCFRWSLDTKAEQVFIEISNRILSREFSENQIKIKYKKEKNGKETLLDMNSAKGLMIMDLVKYSNVLSFSTSVVCLEEESCKFPLTVIYLPFNSPSTEQQEKKISIEEGSTIWRIRQALEETSFFSEILKTDEWERNVSQIGKFKSGAFLACFVWKKSSMFIERICEDSIAIEKSTLRSHHLAFVRLGVISEENLSRNGESLCKSTEKESLKLLVHYEYEDKKKLVWYFGSPFILSIKRQFTGAEIHKILTSFLRDRTILKPKSTERLLIDSDFYVRTNVRLRLYEESKSEGDGPGFSEMIKHDCKFLLWL